VECRPDFFSMAGYATPACHCRAKQTAERREQSCGREASPLGVSSEQEKACWVPTTRQRAKPFPYFWYSIDRSRAALQEQERLLALNVTAECHEPAAPPPDGRVLRFSFGPAL